MVRDAASVLSHPRRSPTAVYASAQFLIHSCVAPRGALPMHFFSHALNLRRSSRFPATRPFSSYLLAALSMAVIISSVFSISASAQQLDTNVRPAPDFGSGGIWLDQGAPAPHHIAD